MDFRADEDHRAYAATVRRLLADAAPLKAARAWAAGDQAPGRALWRSLAETGLAQLAVPEERGGAGWLPPELASAFVEIGRAGAPGPLAETVAATAALGGAGGTGGAGGGGPWLSGLLSGELLATVADPAAGHAADAHLADAAFALADGHLCLAVPSGEPVASVDPARRLVRLTAAEPVADGAAARVRDLAALLTAAQAVGAGRALLDGTVAHAAGREQFGRPIGSFQAVKHRLATVAVALEFAEPLLCAAALWLRDGGADPRDLPAAKAACCDAAYAAARAALQVHGALGYTDEYDLTLLLRKAAALRAAWGTPDACRAAILGEGAAEGV